jgi:transcriptional regulator with XRE-family HTH domain
VGEAERALDGAAVRAARKRAGLKQFQVADALHVTSAAVSQYEAGVAYPSLPKFRQLCLLLGAPPHELLGLSLRREVVESWVLGDTLEEGATGAR